MHRGPPVRTPWSDRVCFAGLGSGEVTVGGRKVVGLSQRRTKAASLFQCACLLTWDPGPLSRILGLPAADLVPMAVGVADRRATVSAAVVEAAFTSVLPGSDGGMGG